MCGNITSRHPLQAPGRPGELRSTDQSDLGVLSHHLFLKSSLTVHLNSCFLKEVLEMGDAKNWSFVKNLGAF